MIVPKSCAEFTVLPEPNKCHGAMYVFKGARTGKGGSFTKIAENMQKQSPGTLLGLVGIGVASLCDVMGSGWALASLYTCCRS
jgi:hypothetical protein